MPYPPPPPACKNSHKTMTAKWICLYFMFLPPPHLLSAPWVCFWFFIICAVLIYTSRVPTLLSSWSGDHSPRPVKNSNKKWTPKVSEYISCFYPPPILRNFLDPLLWNGLAWNGLKYSKMRSYTRFPHIYWSILVFVRVKHLLWKWEIPSLMLLDAKAPFHETYLN